MAYYGHASAAEADPPKPAAAATAAGGLDQGRYLGKYAVRFFCSFTAYNVNVNKRDS
jgi:hypothetical protein